MKLRMIPPLIPDGRGYGRQQRDRTRDRDRRAEQPWRGWYGLPIWDHPITGLRAMQLAREPMCETCRRAPASVAHHKLPHRGVWQLFSDPSNLESACKSCHDGAIQRGERTGNYAPTRDLADGVAVPTNILYPRALRPSAVPLTIVCGAPAAGKSTFVDRQRGADDIVIDLDAIIAALAGTDLRTAEVRRRYLQAALIERNRRLGMLSSDAKGSATCAKLAEPAWFIVGAAPGWQRERWANRLGAKRVVVIETPLEACIERVRRDTRRDRAAGEQGVRDWFARFTPARLACESRVSGFM